MLSCGYDYSDWGVSGSVMIKDYIRNQHRCFFNKNLILKFWWNVFQKKKN
jgi:hypothetical protein